MSVFVQHADRVNPAPTSRLKHWARGVLWVFATPILFGAGLVLLVWQRWDERRES